MPLATIRVPLREADADITLALQPLVDRCYRMGGYWKSDQTNVPGPPLESSDEAWVSEQAREGCVADEALADVFMAVPE